MKLDDIVVAEQEAKKFLARVKVVREAHKKNRTIIYGSKETGALKRQSMELTRALSRMRNTIYA